MVEKAVIQGELSQPQRSEGGTTVVSGPAHKVSIEIDRAVGVGPITGDIKKVEVEYGGQVVTEVPEGEDFKLAITYTAQNPGVSVTDYWTISFTAMSTDGQISGYEHAWIGPGKSSVGPVIDRIEPLGPMPDHDITLRVKFWGNQDYVVTPPYAPPQSQW